MQWFIDLIKDWVIAQAYATQAWVIAQAYATIEHLGAAIRDVKAWVTAQAYATEAWVIGKLCTSTARVWLLNHQLIPTGIWRKITFNVKGWDVNNEFANYKFTAKQAGYFQVNLAAMGIDLLAGQRLNIAITKNGNRTATTWEYAPGPGYYGSYISDVVHLNGTTDYIEGWVYQNAGVSKQIYSGPDYTFMSIHQLSKDS